MALTHQTEYEDRILASEVPEIRLILGGHDHHIVTSFDDKTLIFKAGYDAHHIGVVKLGLERSANGVTVSTSWCLIENRHGKSDPILAEMAIEYENMLQRDMGQVIAHTAGPIDSRQAVVRTQESGMGNLFADALRYRYKSDVAIFNGGAIRGDQLYPAGTPLTQGDIYREHPYQGGSVVL